MYISYIMYCMTEVLRVLHFSAFVLCCFHACPDVKISRRQLYTCIGIQAQPSDISSATSVCFYVASPRVVPCLYVFVCLGFRSMVRRVNQGSPQDFMKAYGVDHASYFCACVLTLYVKVSMRKNKRRGSTCNYCDYVYA